MKELCEGNNLSWLTFHWLQSNFQCSIWSLHDLMYSSFNSLHFHIPFLLPLIDSRSHDSFGSNYVLTWIRFNLHKYISFLSPPDCSHNSIRTKPWTIPTYLGQFHPPHRYSSSVILLVPEIPFIIVSSSVSYQIYCSWYIPPVFSLDWTCVIFSNPFFSFHLILVVFFA